MIILIMSLLSHFTKIHVYKLLNMQRVFIPGSSWLYFKIYTGTKSADVILTDYLMPIIENLREAKIIDNFFFIRYSDPKFHIRFRFHVEDVLNYGSIFQQIKDTFEECLENGIVSSLQCDTYTRELERYGKEHMVDMENIFSIDSEAIIQLIKLSSESDNPEEDRWQLALLLLHDTMTAFNYSIEDKYALAKQMSENYKKEFGFTTSGYLKQLNDKYRRNRKIVEETLHNNNDNLKRYEDALLSRKNKMTEIAKNITYQDRFKMDVIYSLNHMTVNRLFRSKNRLHELVICDFIQRFYDSEIAKNKYCKK